MVSFTRVISRNPCLHGILTIVRYRAKTGIYEAMNGQKKKKDGRLSDVSADDKEQEETKQEKHPKMSKKRKAAIAVGCLLLLILIIAAVVYYVGHRYYAKTNYVTDEEVQKMIEQQKEEQEDEEENEEEEQEVDPELLEAQQNMAQYASTEPITTDGNVYNIMLVGLDTTDKGWVGNSDSMILISINYRLQQIAMISLMRDTHVMIPGIGYRKLNATYPNGGGPLLTKTVEENYKIDVDRYVTVDFGSMIDIIDEIGTIEITFTPKEAENANKSIKQQCRILGLKSKKYLIPGEGTYECNGMQAVAYARIRKVGNSDYQRTERQREVLLKLLDKVKAMSFEDMDRLATRLLPLLTHNVPESEFWGLLAKAPTLINYKIISDRIPYDGMYHGYNGDLVPDWEPTVRKLKETIYGADVLDDEGNVVTPEPAQEASQEAVQGESTEQTAGSDSTADAQGQITMEAEIGTGDPSSQIVRGNDADGQVSSSLQSSRKKAAVVADNTEASDPFNGKKLGNPYADPIFVLRVPQAPEAENTNLVDGQYQWQKPKVSKGIEK